MAKAPLFSAICISGTILSRTRMMIRRDLESPLLSGRPRWPILQLPLPRREAYLGAGTAKPGVGIARVLHLAHRALVGEVLAADRPALGRRGAAATRHKSSNR